MSGTYQLLLQNTIQKFMNNYYKSDQKVGSCQTIKFYL